MAFNVCVINEITANDYTSLHTQKSSTPSHSVIYDKRKLVRRLKIL